MRGKLVNSVRDMPEEWDSLCISDVVIWVESGWNKLCLDGENEGILGLGWGWVRVGVEV